MVGFAGGSTHWMVYASYSQEEQEGWQDFHTTKVTEEEQHYGL